MINKGADEKMEYISWLLLMCLEKNRSIFLLALQANRSLEEIEKLLTVVEKFFA